MSSRTLKLVAASYALKTALFALVWLVAPDLPSQALARLKATWAEVTRQP